MCLALVLVLEKWGLGGGVLEDCTLSELHPAIAGLETLSGAPSSHRHRKTYRYRRSELKMHWFMIFPPLRLCVRFSSLGKRVGNHEAFSSDPDRDRQTWATVCDKLADRDFVTHVITNRR
jgi:hypothetical protein